MRILITGASGFVGNVLLRQLQKFSPDCRISAFVVPDDPFKSSLSPYKGIRMIEGDIVRKEPILRAVKGHTHVVHLAGLISYWRRDQKRLMDVNVKGVENIVAACLEHRIAKLVHLSSVGACGFYKDGTLVTENTPFNWPKSFFYMVSKYKGQRIVEKACQENGLEAAILLPASIMGSGDPNPKSAHNQLVERIYKKKLFGCFSGGLAVVDVRDLVEIIINALHNRDVAGKYLVVGANVKYSKVVKSIGKITGIKVYPFPIPSFILSVVGRSLELLSYLTNRKPLLTYSYGRLSGWKVFYSNKKSRKVFGHEYRPFEKTIEDSCRYFEKNFLS